jgi:outer membrane receptor protein involved in Fe transport
MDSFAVYISGDWLTTEKFDLTAGLRYSRFNIQLPATETNSDVKLTPADLTGDIHAVYAVNPDFKLVANFGRGFRPPNIFDLATLGPRPGNRFNIANTNLDAETVWSYDLGIKLETESLELEVFAFYLDYSDKITSVFTGEVTAGGRDIVRSENRNGVELYGLEAGIYWSATADLRAFAVINYTRGDEQNDQHLTFPADRIPPLNGKLGLEYYFSDNWHVEPYLLFGLRLENLADKAYREHASGIDAPGRNIGFWVSYSLP